MAVQAAQRGSAGKALKSSTTWSVSAGKGATLPGVDLEGLKHRQAGQCWPQGHFPMSGSEPSILPAIVFTESIKCPYHRTVDTVQGQACLPHLPYIISLSSELTHCRSAVLMETEARKPLKLMVPMEDP